ncbi:Serine/threonine-protein kinase tel1 [Maudiozyma exigua]|uniref:Serine/threonine-protein kinase Tel1 n=1 Tax=Maudiozyma exigua TaxID=34358 RepID=A0A9P6WEL6_MAUEX|nr:Serine/threonine-protein kinase tel1 [Kazachstania exigua]
MDNPDILNLLTLLSSSKLRERNAALQTLTTILKDSPSQIPPKTLHPISESLIELLDLEHRKYCNLIEDVNKSNASKISLSENKLSTIAYTIRLFIEKVGERFKQKTLNFHLTILPRLMVIDGTDSLLEAVSVHLSFALIIIVESRPFQLKFTAHQWTSVMEKACNYLDTQIQKSASNRTVSNLIRIIDCLLKLDTIALFDHSLTIHRTITNLVETIEHISVDTRLILEIVNLLVEKTYLNNINQTLKLLEETWKYTINFNTTSNDALHDELTYHYMISSELICHKLPNMTGVTSANFGDEGFIQLLKQILKTRLYNYNPKLLDSETIAYNTDGFPNTLNWLTFCDIRLNSSISPKPWINLLLIMKLLKAFFILKSNTSTTGPLFKRNRSGEEFSSALNNCTNLGSFLIECLSSSSSSKVIITSLQLLTFWSSVSNIEESTISNIKGLILKKFENYDLITWCIIPLIPLLTQSNLHLSKDEIIKIITVCLPLVKERNNCRPACMAISRLVQNSNMSITDTTIMNQIYDIYDLSDVNGPCVVCNESFMFWENIHIYSLEYRSRNGKSAKFNIMSWLTRLWDQIFNNNEIQTHLPYFLLWLAGTEPKETVKKHIFELTEDIDGLHLWESRIRLEEQNRTHRQFFLQTTQHFKIPYVNTSNPQNPSRRTNTETINDILYRGLDVLEKFNSYSPEIILKWKFALLRIEEAIKFNDNYEDFVKGLRNTLYLSKNSTKFESKEVYLQFFEEITVGNFDWNLIKEVFDVDKIFMKFSNQYLIPDVGKKEDDYNDFQKTSPERANKRSTTPSIYGSVSIHNSYIIQISFDALISFLNAESSGATIRSLTEFLGNLTSETIISCIKRLYELSLNKQKASLKMVTGELEELTALIGGKLLSNKYNTFNATMECLSNYLFLFQKYWLSDPNSNLYSDCNDILNWLIARFEDHSFSGTYAMRQVVQLFLNILTYPKLSQNTSKGTKQRIFEILCQCLQRLDINSIMCTESSIISYMKNITYKNQGIFFQEIIKLFDIPQQSLELSASYTLTMIRMSAVSYSLLVQSLLDMLSYCDYSHVKYYTDIGYNIIAELEVMGNRVDLFDTCKLELLTNWIKGITGDHSAIRYPWDVRSFGFEGPNEVYKIYHKEIGAIWISSGSNIKSVPLKLAEYGMKNEADILAKSFYLAIPIAFVGENIGSIIFDVGSQLLGRNFSMYQKRECLLIFKTYLRLLDLGKSDVVNDAIMHYYPRNENWFEVLMTEKSTVTYQFPLHIESVSGIKFMNSHFKDDEFLTSDVFERLLWYELTELENFKTDTEKLRCLREIKVIIFHFGSIYLQSKDYRSIIEKISDNIKQDYLINDTVPLIELLISEKTLKDVMLNTLSKISALSNNAYSTLWSICMEHLLSNITTINYSLICKLLESELYTEQMLTIISVLLLDNERVLLEKSPVRLSEIAIFRLMDADISRKYMSDRFIISKALFMRDNYDKIALTPKNSNTNSTASENNMLFKSANPLEIFYQSFLDFYLKLTIRNSSSKTFLICSLVIGTLDYSRGNISLKDCVKNILQNIPDKIEAAHITLFDTLFPNWKISSTADNFVNDAEIFVEHSVSKWQIEFLSVLLKVVSYTFPVLELFHPLIIESKLYLERGFNIVFCLSLFFEPRGFIEWYPNLITTVVKNKNALDYESKLRIVLSTVVIVRYGSKMGNKCCERVFQKLDITEICWLAAEAKMPIFGLMVFEEAFMGTQKSENYTLLSKMYDLIGDKDFQSGVPPEHSLKGAFNSIIKLGYDPWKSFVFSNARLDANYNLQTSEKFQLLNAISEKNGFYGMTQSINSNNKSLEGDQNYEWSFRLGNWDLPTPVDLNTVSKGLYTTMKAIQRETNSVKTAIEDSLVRIMKSEKMFDNSKTWTSLVVEVGKFIDIANNLTPGISMDGGFNAIFESIDKCRYSDDYNDINPILQGRYYFLCSLTANKKLYDKLDPVKVDMMKMVALKDQITTSIKCNHQQDSLRSSFVLNSLKQDAELRTQDLTVKSSYNRINSYLSAITLWESGDYKTPIMMLNDILKAENLTSNSDVSNYKVLLDQLKIENSSLLGYLVKWCSTSRMESSNNIYQRYIHGKNIGITNTELRAKTYLIFGDFLNSQLKKLHSGEEIEKCKERCKIGKLNMDNLNMIKNNTSLPEKERRDAKRHLFKVNLQLEGDQSRLDDLQKLQFEFTDDALHFYLNTLISTNTYDSDVMDKFCALWFENADNTLINQKLKEKITLIPSWKFIPWVNQISSKLNNDGSMFQQPLQLTMKRLLYKLPYESLYSVLSIKLYERYSIGNEGSIKGRIVAARRILDSVSVLESGAFFKKYVLPVQEFCERSVELAGFKINEASKTLQLKNLKMGDYWLNILPKRSIPLPTDHIVLTSSEDGKNDRPYITSVIDDIQVTATGISLPKIVKFRMSNGEINRVLMKGSNDDLRQDAIMEQVFTQVNNILFQNEELRKAKLRIRTYKVIPLGPRAGIIEFVNNSVSLHQVLQEYHKSDELSFRDARKAMKGVQTKSNMERLKVYNKITSMIYPQLRNFFFDNFRDYHDWFIAKKCYTKGIATNSIVGYILGLGDRHLNNILLDSVTGEPIHIDLGIAFDQGRLLMIPELVPFRLTRDIIDGFGITGVEGLFKRSSERVYAALKEEAEKVMCVLNVLKWDPLYSWVMSPVTKHKHLLEDETDDETSTDMTNDNRTMKHADDDNDNQESYRALKGVEDKLNGDGLRIEATVAGLIQEAVNPENLSVIYMGWSPFY